MGSASRGSAAHVRSQAAAAIVVGGVLLWWGRASLAAVAVVLVVLTAQLPLVAPGAAARLAWATTSLASLVGRVVSVALLGLAFVAFIVAGSVRAVVRNDPLALRGPGVRGWQPVPRSVSTRTYITEPARPPRPGAVGYVARAIPLVAFAVAALLLLDLAAGLAWRDPPPSGVVTAARLDPSSEALADAPWAEAHVEDLAALTFRHRPYVLTTVDDLASETVVVEGGLRQTYAPGDLGADAQEIWVFGGAAAFGEGQRDEHTLPSALARV
ncbi:hypothetical protein B7486_66020, partial [cyanobacterium TDX16]